MSDSNVSTPKLSNKLNSNANSGQLEELSFEPLTFDIEELDDEEYQIPTITEPPTLESILNEPDDGYSLSEELEVPQSNFLEPNSDTQSLGSQRSRSGERKKLTLLSTADTRSETLSVTSQRSGGERRRVSTGILRHVLLKGISVQLASAAERVDGGTASAVAIGAVLAVGTSRGLVLVFDSRQVLRWVLESPEKEHGSVSCLTFNADSSRLLAGFARGLIMMFDLSNGNTLRKLSDVHPPNTAVLSIKFTDLPNLALCADSGGSVFELMFTRTLGMRGCDTRCLFSGSRGEVMTMSPLLLAGLRHPLEGYVITAMATLTKVIVVCVRPKLRVVLVRPLSGGAGALPLLAWQLVPLQARSPRTADPVLSCAKGDTIFFYKVSVDGDGKLRIVTTQKMVVGFPLLACHWMNAWTLALLDEAERLHVTDVVTNEKLEACDLSAVGLVYESSHFKGIFTGGNVSPAMARAGDKACYNTVISSGGQLLMLGAKSLHALTIRPWAERLTYLVNQRKYALALSLAQSFYDDPKTVTGVRGSTERKKAAARAQAVSVLKKFISDLSNPQDDIHTIVQYAVQLKAQDVLFTGLWDAVYLDNNNKVIFLSALEPYILNDQLSSVPPAILQQFVLSYEQSGKYQALEACILHLDIASLDLHLVMQICKAHALYDAIIYIQNQAFVDYVSPINDLLPILHTALNSGNDLTGKDVELGNKLLVYISCCLAGRGYPYGDVPKELVQTVKHDVYTCITCMHSTKRDDNELAYPYLRTLLHFDTREFLNVVALAFTEPEFTSELGLAQRQRLVDILLNVVVGCPEFSAREVGTLFTFLARQLSRPGSGLTIPPDKFHPVFEYLTDAGPSHRDERQQTLLELLRAAGLQGFPKDTLLDRARQAQFFRVCEVIYEQCGEWDQVFRCYLDDPQRRPQVFSFLRNMFVLTSNPDDVRLLLDAVQARVPDLLALDEAMTGHFVRKMMADRLPSMMQALGDEQRHALLRSALYSRDDPKIELVAKYLPLYIELTAKLQPSQVVPALRSYYSHIADLDEMLDVVRACGHVEAQAFILEKTGDFANAFRVLNERLDRLLESATSVTENDEAMRLVKAAVTVLQSPSSNSSEQWTELLNTVLTKTGLPNPEKTKLLEVILSGSAGFSNPSAILDFLLRHPAYSGATFGDLRHLFTGMLEDSRYEEMLASTTLRLVHSDLHAQLASSMRGTRKAIRATAAACSVCDGSLCRSTVVVFPCGHPVHDKCVASCQCPVCATIAVGQVPFPEPVQTGAATAHSSSSASFHQLQLSARPITDLEILY